MYNAVTGQKHRTLTKTVVLFVYPQTYFQAGQASRTVVKKDKK